MIRRPSTGMTKRTSCACVAQLTDDPVPLAAVSRSGIDSPAVDARTVLTT